MKKQEVNAIVDESLELRMHCHFISTATIKLAFGDAAGMVKRKLLFSERQELIYMFCVKKCIDLTLAATQNFRIHSASS